MPNSDDVENKVSDELNFSKKAFSASQYRMVNVHPEVQPVLQLNSFSTATFNLPNTVYNLARTALSFDVTVDAAANTYRFLRTGHFACIDSLELSTMEGVKIAECNNLNHFSKINLRATNCMKDYLTYPRHDPSDACVGTGSCYESGQLFGPARNTDFKHYAPDADGKFVLSVTNLDAARKGDLTFNTLAADDAVVPAAEEPVQEFVRSAINTDLFMRVHLPLDLISHAAFQVSKDLYWNQSLRLTVRLAPGLSWGYQATAVAEVKATTEADAKAAFTHTRAAYPDWSTRAALGFCPTIGNFILKLAVASDPFLAQKVIKKTMEEGVRLTIPYYHSAKFTNTSAGLNTFIRRYNNTYGRSLVGIYVGVFNPTETDTRNFHNYNHGAILWRSVRSSIDSKPRQDYELNVNNSDVYRWLQPMLKGSCITSNKDFNENAFWIENFSGSKLCETKMHAEHIAGIPLETELEYSVQLNLAQANSIVYIWAITQKELVITGTGIAIM